MWPTSAIVPLRSVSVRLAVRTDRRMTAVAANQQYEDPDDQRSADKHQRASSWVCWPEISTSADELSELRGLPSH
jgi:hypothetical protein